MIINFRIATLIFSLTGGLLMPGYVSGESAIKHNAAGPLDNITVTINVKQVKRLISLNDMACLLTEDGHVSCWGPEAKGELQLSQLRHVNLGAGNIATDIYGGGSDAGGYLEAGLHACATLKNGGVRCWGDFKDALFNSADLFDYSTSKTPLASNEIISYPLKADVLQKMDSPVRLFLYANVLCSLSKEGSLYCPHKHLQFLNGQKEIKDAYFGEMLSCLHYQAGHVDCFDMRGKGDHKPIRISFDGEISPKYFAARYVHTDNLCIIDRENLVACWEGQSPQDAIYSYIHMFGVNTVNIPVKSKPLSISMVESHTCVLFENGRANCWGRNISQQILDDKKISLIKTPGIVVNLGTNAKITSMALAPNSSCFLLDNQQIKCLGSLYKKKGSDSN